MLPLPSAAQPLVARFSVAFSDRIFQRIIVLMIGAIVTMGRRTVTNVLWSVRSIADGHFSSYHRVFSRASWSPWPLGKMLATAVLQWVPPDQPVLVAGDDTVAQHRGKKVYGKAKHRDGVRSSHSMTVWKWGHKWVVLTIVIRLPFTSRRWALPVLCALYRSKEQNKAEGRRHKTPAQLARQRMAVLVHWFPRRKFVFLGAPRNPGTAASARTSWRGSSIVIAATSGGTSGGTSRWSADSMRMPTCTPRRRNASVASADRGSRARSCLRRARRSRRASAADARR